MDGVSFVLHIVYPNLYHMLRTIFFLCFIVLVLSSCTSSNSLFNSNNLYEEYGKKLTNAGLKQTALGRHWFAAAEKALALPQTIRLPYKETGYFPADKPAAVGLSFAVKRGERVIIQLTQNPINGFAIYGDIWQVNENHKSSLALSLDTAKQDFTYEVKRTGSLIIRLQSELLKSGNYTIAITTGPSLRFPVAGNKGRIISYYGAARDAGKRSHEGVDIAAPFRTPAIAPANGVVSRVTENTLGGKVVFFNPANEDFTLYYAHLDEQLVTAGQRLAQGDTVGLIGNTGNAKNTVSHLHFGIYTFSGAIDPLPFINPVIQTPLGIKAPVESLYSPYRLTKNFKTDDTLLKSLTYIVPIAAEANSYRAILPNGQTAIVPALAIQAIEKPLKQIKVSGEEKLLELPDSTAPVITYIAPNTDVSLLAYYGSYAYVQYKTTFGWIKSEGRF